jgi:uncharacterized protein YxjI
MASTTDDAISGIELTDDEHRVVRALIRNKYQAYDSAGDLVLKGKQSMFRTKEEFPFVDAEDNSVFTVTAGGILDVAGDYTLTDDTTGEPVVVLDKNWTWVSTRWKIRDPDTEALIAEIKSKSKLVDFIRDINVIFELIPHKYEITDTDGEHVGDINGQLSLKQKYVVTIDDASDVPKEAVVAAAMVIDALGG